MRNFEVYRYRADESFQDMIRPIKTAFFSLSNLAELKLEFDKLSISISQSQLHELMTQAYNYDDEVQKAELMATTGRVDLRKGVERLNKYVIEQLKQRLARGAREGHARFLQDAAAFLGGDQGKLFSFTGLNQYTRQDVQRHNGYIDMFRF